MDLHFLGTPQVKQVTDLKANHTRHQVILRGGTVEQAVRVLVVACRMVPRPAVKMPSNPNFRWVNQKSNTKQNQFWPNFPFPGTIKRKPSMKPSLPLTSITRQLKEVGETRDEVDDAAQITTNPVSYTNTGKFKPSLKPGQVFSETFFGP